MAKGKARISSSEDLPSARTQSLRSRKRRCPSDEASSNGDVEALFHPKDTEGGDGVVTALQSPMPECTVIISQEDRAVEQFCVTKQNGSVADEHADVTKVVATAQEETTVRNLNNSQLENCGLHADDDVRKNEENREETVSEECNKSPGQTGFDQFQVLPLFKEDDESYEGVMEKQTGGEDTSDLEKNQSTSQDIAATMYVSDLKESPAGLPAKKKRRMGSCALTEKERSTFLQIQNRENGHDGMTETEKETADSVGLEGNVCSPSLPSPLLLTSACHITEEREREQKGQCSHCGEDGRAETEINITVTTSDGTSTVGDPGAEGGTGSGPQIPGNTESCQLAKQEEGGHLGNQELQELPKPTTENMDEIPEKEMKRVEDMTAEEDLSVAVACKTSLNEESGLQDAVVAALPEINSLNTTNDEMCVGDTDDGASDAKARSSGSVELCEASVTPGVVEKEFNHDPDDGTAASPSAEYDERTRAEDSSDTFGPGCLDYVSDSQLNTIVLIEEGVMEEEADPSGQLEDASELVCGLIRELSSLNRKVMAAHRELANLRRSSKTSRSSVR